MSPCRTWRYSLWRLWDPALPLLGVVGLNPSTADETRDDPTLRRCVGFARRWGFGGVLLVNLFAYRATAPDALARARDPVGPANDRRIARSLARVRCVLVAWGEGGSLRGRDARMLRLLRGAELWCLGRTRSGQPRHPLYVRADAAPLRYAPFRRQPRAGSSRRGSSPTRAARHDARARRRM